jgi:hypothetical protein
MAVIIGVSYRCLHQLSSNASVLDRWIDRDWPNAGYGRMQIDKDAADDHSIVLGHYSVETGVLDQHRGYPGCGFHGWEVGYEIMLPGYGSECVVDDAPTVRRIRLGGLPKFRHAPPDF